MSSPPPSDLSTSVIVHDVHPRHRADYERWMERATQAHQRFPGYVATDILMPAGAGLRYVVILRFCSSASASEWLLSPLRRALLEEARPWLLARDRFRVHDDAEFWFAPSQNGPAPARWKQWLLSTSAVLPLTAIVPPLVKMPGQSFAPGIPLAAEMLASAAIISALMVYWIMPRLTRAASVWLSR